MYPDMLEFIHGYTYNTFMHTYSDMDTYIHTHVHVFRYRYVHTHSHTRN